MALRYYVQDQVPLLMQAQSDQSYNAIAGSGAAIGKGISDLADRMERKREADKLLMANAKAAETLYKNNPSFQKIIGKSTDEFGALSAEDKLALMQSGVTHLTLQQAQAKAAREQAEADNAARFPAFARELSQMGQDPASLPMVLNETERARRTAPLDFRGVMGAAARTGYQPDSSLMDDLIRANSQPPKLGMSEAFDMARTPPPGFGTGKVTISSTGTPSLQFDPAAATGAATPILLQNGQPTGKAMLGDKIIDIQTPNSEGKTLTTGETQSIQALSQAEIDLNNLEKMFEKLGPDWAGPISGRMMSALGMGQNPDIAAIENAINAATPNLARGVFREVGVLTDEDIKRYKSQLPSPYDTDAVRKVKLQQLRERLKAGKAETMDTLRKSGRDLSGFDNPATKQVAPPTPGAPAAKSSAVLDQARSAIKSGKDPAAVKARYKELTGEDFPE